MPKINFEKRLLVGITGCRDSDWQNKLDEINKFKINECSLFLTRFDEKQRKNIYKALEASCVKKIPLIHIKNDMNREEIDVLYKLHKPRYLTMHENGFSFLHKWKKYQKKLYLEMNISDYVPKNTDVKKIGGFCVDLSHFKISLTSLQKEFDYIYNFRDIKKYFACNHLNGYSSADNKHKHTIDSLKDFEYLKTLPKFVFGKYIAIETDNSIREQLKFKKYLARILFEKFSSIA